MTGFVLWQCLLLLMPGVAVGQATYSLAPGQAGLLAGDLRDELDHALSEFDQAQAVQVEQPDRARRLFRSAAQRFESIRAAGVRNGRLEYNLGNCLLQVGDVGRAILHYRRAQRLIPGDPMLEDNLGVARSRCVTSIKPAGRSAFLRSAFFWHYGTSAAGRMRVALISFFGIWVFLTLRNFVRAGTVTLLAVACAALMLLLTGSLAMSHWSDRNRPEGVVTEMDVVVSKGPGEGYQRLFEQPLQPGVEFTLRNRTRGGWWKIELPDGNRGWIPADAAELIPDSTG